MYVLLSLLVLLLLATWAGSRNQENFESCIQDSTFKMHSHTHFPPCSTWNGKDNYGCDGVKVKQD